MHEFLEPGDVVRVREPGKLGAGQYRQVAHTEPAYFEYRWTAADGSDDTVASGVESEPKNLDDLKPMAETELVELTFGIRGTAAIVYVSLPLETRLFGLSRRPIATSANRSVGGLTEADSPWEDPSSRSLLWLLKGGSFEIPSFTVYNNSSRTIVPELKFVLAKHLLIDVTEPEILDQLARDVRPSRLIEFGGLPPVRSGVG